MDHSQLLTVALAGIGGVVWLVRLEGRVNHNSKLIEYEQKAREVLTAKFEALDSKLVEKLSEVEKSLARIEGYLQKAKEGEKE